MNGRHVKTYYKYVTRVCAMDYFHRRWSGFGREGGDIALSTLRTPNVQAVPEFGRRWGLGFSGEGYHDGGDDLSQ